MASARLHARNRRLGVFVVLVGAGGLWLSFQTYVPSVRSGDLGAFGYPMLALWAAVALGVMLLGAPAKIVRELTDEEIGLIRYSAKHYAENAARYLESLAPYEP